jgi:LmbE family N-acetylglucosaminyl deacetylase
MTLLQHFHRIWTLAVSLALVCFGTGTWGASPAKDSAELQLALGKLQVLGSVLYVAAHPDDENTAALAYFSKGRKLRTAYLSMTRGGGGQDLIGPELDNSLAAIRTQELLAARRVDGAEQFFTRAVDFGYSKNSEETLSIWGHEAALSDVVWVIRSFRPDVIITRFTPTAGGHGHHLSSAILALEGFKAAADPTRFPEQLKFVKPWQATRIAWNSFRPQFEQGPPTTANALVVDTGSYDPLLGKSYAELAAEGRSMHRSQGFGAVAQRGSSLQYFEITAGKPAKADLFEDVDLSWQRIPGGEVVGELLAQARSSFLPEQPIKALRMLLQAMATLDRLQPDPWVEAKRLELSEVIRCVAGIWVEAIADRQAVAPLDRVTVVATVMARAGAPITLTSLTVNPSMENRARQVVLPLNQSVKENFTLTIPLGTPCTQPYWLGEGKRSGLHATASHELTGLPEGPPALSVTFHLIAEGVPFSLTVPVQYRFRDPVLGERYQPLTIMPEVMVNLADGVQVIDGMGAPAIGLSIVAGRAQVTGKIHLEVPDGWRVEPSEIPFSLTKPLDEIKVRARITAPQLPQTGEMKVAVELGGRAEPGRGRVVIDYPHIPLQTLFPIASARLVKVDLRHYGHRIGYVMGAGDDIPQRLRPLGYEVDLLSDETLATADLSGFDAIVIGIRAFNTRPHLSQLNARLLDYVAKGGIEIVLYNVNGAFPGTNAGLTTESIGPFPFKIGRERVTDESVPVKFLVPEHPILNVPNKITAEDFKGWVQERGLNFAESWDPKYTPILGMGDPGEKPLEGALLVAAHGKGHFVYTGLAFFRQLPEGVPGAYRLFANLLALGTKHD